MTIALELEVHPGPRERGEHLVQARDPVNGKLRHLEAVHALPNVLDARERGVVEQHGDAIAGQADVELHAVAARDPHRGLERKAACSPGPRGNRRGERAAVAAGHAASPDSNPVTRHPGR